MKHLFSSFQKPSYTAFKTDVPRDLQDLSGITVDMVVSPIAMVYCLR